MKRIDFSIKTDLTKSKKNENCNYYENDKSLKMDENSFIKREPLILKAIYVIGIISFIIYHSDLLVLNIVLNKILSIIGLVGMILFFIRMIMSSSKNVQ